MSKPTVLPEWAINDVVDGTSGENNVVEPTQDFKDNGWVPYLMKPFRQYMNWIHRHTYLWCKWAKEEGVSFLHGTELAKVIDSFFESEVGFQISWTKVADVVTLNFPELLAEGAGGVNGDRIIISPVTTWDSNILPISVMSTLQVPFQAEEGVSPSSRIGQINIPTGGGSTWLIERPDNNGDLGLNNFTSDDSVRGWRHQCISYITEDSLG